MNDELTLSYASPPRPLGVPVAQRLGGHLVRCGLVSAADMEAALFEQRHHPGMRLGELLLSMGLVGPQDLMRALDELAARRAD